MRDIYQWYSYITHGKVLYFQLEELLRKSINSLFLLRFHDTIAQDFLSPLCPHGVHLFASSPWPVNTGCCLEAIVITICYRM
jgi:hypothetical protein